MFCICVNKRTYLLLTYHTDGQAIGMQNNADNRPHFLYPERELFLWAVLLNRQEIARIFWRASADHIGGALTACMLMRSLAKAADNEGELDLAEQLRVNAEYV